MVKRRLGLMAVAPLVLFGPRGVVHPMHTTFTEITQPAIPGVVLITLRGFEDDLTSASRVVMPGISADSALAQYLRQHLLLTDRNGHRIALDATGVRRVGDVVWVAFQSSRPVDLAGSRFLNAALTERYADQVNLVQVKTRQRTSTILFTPGDKAKIIGD